MLNTFSFKTLAAGALALGAAIGGQAMASETALDWRSPELWKNHQLSSVEYFEKKAWDPVSGTYASELDREGKQKSETRYLIALSRMVYGLSHTSIHNPAYLEKARRSADFILNRMTTQDELGPYFLSAVDAQGNPVGTRQTKLVVQEQAYGLNGLVALYSISGNPAVLQRIHALYDSFYRRFHDPVHGGFFDQYDLETKAPVRTKSYDSTVYVATAFLAELAKADSSRTQDYQRTLVELTDIVATHFLDPSTGWLIEVFSVDWKADWRGWKKKDPYTLSEVGHNFQSAWLLLRASQLKGLDSERKARYLSIAQQIIESMLSKPVVDTEYGGFYSVFRRETNEVEFNRNKWWWQQAEAILALTLAEQLGVVRTEQAALARDRAVDFYFRHFVDAAGGGEFSEVTRVGQPIEGVFKGGKGKSTYHTVELARYMLEYRDLLLSSR